MTAALGLACSLALALLLAFLCLKFLVSLVTREQYNVTDAPRRVRAIVWSGDGNRPADASGAANSDTGGGATSIPYRLPAAAPPNRFARASKSVDAAGGGVVNISQPVRSRTAEGGRRDSGRGIR